MDVWADWYGKSYDSEAIVGVAHGHLSGRQPLTVIEFGGGEATVGSLPRRLGFTLQVDDGLTPPAWKASSLSSVSTAAKVSRPVPAHHAAVGILPRPPRRAPPRLLA